MLRLPDSGAQTLPDGRRLVPSAQRNAPAIAQLLQRFDLRGRLLEIASGSGLHAAQIAPAFPDLVWQPSDVDAGNMASIRAWTAGLPNVSPPIVLDACAAGWHRGLAPQDAILLVNLFHLISEDAARCLMAEACMALARGGRWFIYGPFLRDGKATSAGDAAFDADLRAQDPRLGYKDIGMVTTHLQGAGLGCEVVAMPANNVMLIAHKTA
jgi:Protein of unknown function (DUF938)